MTGYEACRAVLVGVAVGCTVLLGVAVAAGDVVAAGILVGVILVGVGGVALLGRRERAVRRAVGMDAGPAMRLFGAGSGESEARAQLGLAVGHGETGRVSFTVERDGGDLRDTLRVEFARGTFVMTAPRLAHWWEP